MSFNTQPTRINELLVDSDQTWVSRKSFRVPSDGTAAFDGPFVFSNLTRNTKATPAAGDIGDEELTINIDDDTGASSDATITFKSGNTVYEWDADRVST